MTESDQNMATQSLSDIAYQEIKRNIITTVYPPGAFLTESRLAEELNTSRMPVRTAVQRLEDEGWLIANFRRKIQVKEVTKADIEEIFQLRELLETNALRLIFELDKTWEYSHRIEAKVVYIKAAQDNLYEFERAETEMHMEMVSIYNSSRIDRIYRSNQEELIRIGLLTKRIEPNVAEIITNLYGLVEAIREKRLAEALEIAKTHHLEAGRANALRLLDHFTSL